MLLLSINPKFCNKIWTGEKKFEYRRVLPKLDVTEILIYSTAPEKKLSGIIVDFEYITAPLCQLWEITGKYSGVAEQDFFNYFKGKNEGNAIFLKEVVRFDNALTPSEVFFSFAAPQSFKYVERRDVERLQTKISRQLSTLR